MTGITAIRVDDEKNVIDKAFYLRSKRINHF